MDKTILAEFLEVCRGEKEADFVLRNGLLVNVLSSEIYKEDIAIYNKYIVGLGKNYKGKREINLKGKYVCPGLIDAHIHIESTFLSPWEFSRVVASHGTSCIISDPHEIANVMGIKGIEFLIKSTENLDVDFFFMVPSCVPATDLETSGAEIGEKEIIYLYERYPHKILGLAEVMNFPGTYLGDKKILSKLLLSQRKIIDGHAPLLTGRPLNAYIFAGPKSDHECVSKEEALEKLRKGMYIFVREGTTEKNLKSLLPIINEKNISRFCLVTDDRHADELFEQGHMDFTVKKAIELGIEPISAVKMATINPANYFGLKRHGAIIPGNYANLLVLNDINRFDLDKVILKGKDISTNTENPAVDKLSFKSALNMREIKQDDLGIPYKNKKIMVIKVIPDQIITDKIILEPKVKDGFVVSDIQRDILKIAVIERHKNTGNIGIGLVNGLRIKNGAVATTVAHDSHNLIVTGVSDGDMAFAANFLRKTGGGLVLVNKGKTISFLPLQIGGLMSLYRAEMVVNELKEMDKVVKNITPMGMKVFMYLSFLALPVIPKLKITDKGLVDVEKFNLISLWVK